MRMILLAALAVVVLVAGWWLLADDGGGGAVSAAIVVPELSAVAERGRTLFQANCAKCHGQNAGGTDQGPPLVHRLYEPSHHADLGFLLAVQQGVRPHHWKFGPMPAVEGVSEPEVTSIVAYVRELQRANGIE